MSEPTAAVPPPELSPALLAIAPDDSPAVRQGKWPRALAGWAQGQVARAIARWRTLDSPGRWEIAAYLLLLATALGMRLWDLGGKTLHYDELLHAWYSWLFAQGGGFSHTPLMHGPFLFHVNAAVYRVFGASDATARLLPALFGTALVGLPYLLRRELGRPGALATAVLLAISPSMLYFSRFIRNDIYMVVWMLALVIVIWRFAQGPKLRLLVAWVAVWALAFSTKETAFISAGLLGLALLLMALPELARWVRGALPSAALPSYGVLFLLLATMTLAFGAPALGLFQDWLGIVLVNPDPNDPIGGVARADAPTGSPVGVGLYVAAFLVIAFAALSAVVGMFWDRRRWPLLALVFVAVWLPLYTSLFTNWQGFFTGLWGSLGYWIAQQPVERAGQPWYYYLLSLANYEFLAVLPGLVAAPFLALRGRLFDRFLVYWAVGTLLAYSFAGEKMPWLAVNMTLPFALLSGRAVGLMLGWVPWQGLEIKRAAIVGLGGAVLLALVAVTVLQMIGPVGSASVAATSFASSPLFWASVVGLAAAVSVVAFVAPRKRLRAPPPAAMEPMTVSESPWQGRRVGMAVAASGALLVLLAMTAFVAGRASYSYAGFQQPTEMLVYAQTGQETTLAAQKIERIALASGKGKEGLRVLVDEHDSMAWQWRWYLRDYQLVTYQFLNNTPVEDWPQADVVLLSRAADLQQSGALTGFTRADPLRQLWWFPKSVYDRLSPGSLVRGVASKDGWRGVLDYFFFRRLGTSMQHADGVMHIADEYASIR